ncbi:hypothetical protein K4K56_001248 [Colletotrichum sp. SAR 10_98]|nr:hypothetical protein K4K56_001248 [Colletotrichum sp. SAR 10_98]
MSLQILVDPTEADVDILAVHGLNPSGKENHALATWSNGEHIWLRDAFPSKEPKARVMMYEYNASVVFHSSVAGVNECADKLLGDHPKRPLIFICHSLGGIIVKAVRLTDSTLQIFANIKWHTKAIVEASLNANLKYQQIRDATYGLVFFATPHHGSDYADLGGVAATIAGAVLRQPKNSFLDSLKRDSLFSDTLKKHFRHRLEDFKIISFYETLPMMKMKHPIVGMRSAVLGLASQREEAFSIDTNHVDICKFYGPEDPNYKFVASQISALCQEAKDNILEDETQLYEQLKRG